MTEDNSSINKLHADIAGLKKGLEANENGIVQVRDLVTQRFNELAETIQHVQNNQHMDQQNQNSGGKQTGLISLFIAALAAVAAPIGVTLSFQQNALSNHEKSNKESFENMRIDYVERDRRIIEQQDKLTDRIDNLQSKVNSHIGMANQKFESDDERISALENTIHQEIQSVQNLLEERIENLDTVLQREMRLLDETNNTKVSNLRNEIQNLQTRLRTLEMMANGMSTSRDK